MYFQHIKYSCKLSGDDDPDNVSFDDREILWRVVRSRVRDMRIGRFLDVGAGDGYLTERIAMNADETVAVEPDHRCHAKLARRSIRNLTIIEEPIEDCAFGGISFDLILLSHSIYHIQRWPQIRCKMRDLLSDRGRILVLTQTGMGSFHEALNIVRDTLIAQSAYLSYPYASIVPADAPAPRPVFSFFTIEMGFESMSSAFTYIEGLFGNLSIRHRPKYQRDLSEYLDKHRAAKGVALQDIQCAVEWKPCRFKGGVESWG